MTDITKLKELRERVIAAKGPDRELDITILATLLCAKAFVVEQSRFNGAWVAMTEERRGPVCWEAPSPFNRKNEVTASIDAALALVERMLPGWHKDLYINTSGGARLNIRKMPSEYAEGLASTPPLAILATLLSALISQAERAGE